MKLMCLTVLLVPGFLGSSAFADDLNVVPFTLSTTGSFSSGTSKDLSFYGATLTGESDDDGFLALGNLGTFTLTEPNKGTNTFHPKTDEFELDLTFLAPLGIAGNNVFDATLKGKVKRDGGSVFIDFGPTQSFTFKNDTASGGFDLTLNDITLKLSDDEHDVSQVLTGKITNAFDPPAAVPEPQAVVLLATVVLLTGLVLRRRPAHRG
jgi:hypothetical protein